MEKTKEQKAREEHAVNVAAYQLRKPSLSDGWWALFVKGKFIGQWESKNDLLKVVNFSRQGYIVQVGRENVGTEIGGVWGPHKK